MNRITDVEKENVKVAAEHIQSCAGVMKNIFNDLISTVNTVSADDVFYGQASSTAAANFASIKSTFDNYTANVERFSNMLLSAVESIEQTDRNLANSANNLPR